jgi:uncharacterized protein YkwD
MKLLLILLVLFFSGKAISQNTRTLDDVKIFNSEFIKLVNSERKKLKLDTLIESTNLSKYSSNWNIKCVSVNKLSHSNIQDNFNSYTGEVVTVSGNNSPLESAKAVFESFMSSQSHKDILLSPDVKYIGVSEYFGLMNVLNRKTKYTGTICTAVLSEGKTYVKM